MFTLAEIIHEIYFKERKCTTCEVFPGLRMLTLFNNQRSELFHLKISHKAFKHFSDSVRNSLIKNIFGNIISRTKFIVHFAGQDPVEKFYVRKPFLYS